VLIAMMRPRFCDHIRDEGLRHQHVLEDAALELRPVVVRRLFQHLRPLILDDRVGDDDVERAELLFHGFATHG
jgi:hypothetical protein